MRLSDLGPLLVSADGDPVPVRGERPIAILTLLLINANREVGVSTLVDALWDEGTTPRHVGTLESHIYRVRQLVEPARAAGAAFSVLLKERHGYRMLVDSEQVDSLRFVSLGDEVESLAASGQYERVRRRCDEALALWRGRPGGSMADRDWAQPWVARLTEMHDLLAERRVEALIETGDPERAVSDLAPLLRDAPFREALHAHRMLALYRCGRTNEALEAYQQARRALRDELGVDPGRSLVWLQQRILDHDPALIPAAVAAEPDQPDHATVAARIHLPLPLTPLIGRTELRDDVLERLATERLVTLTGTAGAGKTRLAVEAGRGAATDFPDGVWLVDLDTVVDGGLVVDAVGSALGVAAASGRSSAHPLYRYLQGRRLLLVLDNCEHLLDDVAHLVKELLSADAELSILATSREPLDVDGEFVVTVPPLAGPDPDAVGDGPAVELFLARLQSSAPRLTAEAEPDRLRQLATQICSAVDGLPLAIELAAARARTYTLEEILEQVGSDPVRLARAGRPGTDRRRSLQATLDWSHRLLSVPEQVVYRRLAVLPGRFTLAVAAATTGQAPAEIANLIPMLVNRSLLAATPAGESGRPTTYQQINVVRAHAAGALTQAGETEVSLDRRDHWVAQLATRTSRTDRAELARLCADVEDNYPAVRAMLHRNLVVRVTPSGVRVAGWLIGYWFYRGQLLEGLGWLQRAARILDDQPAGGPRQFSALDAAWVRFGLAKLLAHQGRIDLVRPQVAAGLALADRIEVAEQAAFALDLAILAGDVWTAGDPELAETVLHAEPLAAAAAADANLAVLRAAAGALVESSRVDPTRTAARVAEVYPQARALGFDLAAWLAARAGVAVARDAADVASGLRWSGRVMELHRRQGGGLGGGFIESRANFLALAGQHRAAMVLYAAARSQLRREGWAWQPGPETIELRAAVREALDPDELDAASREGERLSLAELARIGPEIGLD